MNERNLFNLVTHHCSMKFIALIISAIFLSFLLSSQQIYAVPSAQWEIRSNPTATPIAVTSGTINPDTGKEARLVVSNLDAGCQVSDIEYFEEDLGFWNSDDSGGRPTRDGSGTTWASPPSQRDDPGDESEWYGIVSVVCEDPKKSMTFKTGIINVRHDHLEESTAEEKASVNASGEVGAKGHAAASAGVASGEVSAKGSVSGTYEKHSITKTNAKTGMVDPEVIFSIYNHTRLPDKWNLAVEPQKATLGPNDEIELTINYVAPSPGYVFYSIVTTTPNTITHSQPTMLLVDDKSELRQLREVRHDDKLYKFLYNFDTPKNTASVDDIGFDLNAKSIIISITATEDGELQIFIPFSMLDNLDGSDLDVSVDGQKVTANNIMPNEVSRYLSIPYTTSSHTITISGDDMFDKTRIAAGFVTVPEFSSFTIFMLLIGITGIIFAAKRTSIINIKIN